MKLERMKSRKRDISVVKCLDCNTRFEYSSRSLKAREELEKSHALECDDRQKILKSTDENL
jgi:hypothetical protein